MGISVSFEEKREDKSTRQFPAHQTLEPIGDSRAANKIADRDYGSIYPTRVGGV